MPPETKEQREAHTNRLIEALDKSNFSYSRYKGRFFCIEGDDYDLSVADPDQIGRIVNEGFFRIQS